MDSIDQNIYIVHAITKKDLEAIANLFEAYAHSLGIDLSFQDFKTELSSLPGKYAPPRGALLLARDASGHPIGCVGLRPSPESSPITTSHVDAESTGNRCEMKRLYITPAGRGRGLGKELATKAIELARSIGYRAIVLDTLPTMRSAQAVYRSLGFVTTDAYYDTPIEHTLFMELRLDGKP